MHTLQCLHTDPITNTIQLHTVSSLSQTYTGNLQAETAVNQGNDLKILTKMTVVSHVRSAPCTCIDTATSITTSIANHNEHSTSPFHYSLQQHFSAWTSLDRSTHGLCSSVLALISLVSYMIASPRSSKRVWTKCKAWQDATVWKLKHN